MSLEDELESFEEKLCFMEDALQNITRNFSCALKVYTEVKSALDILTEENHNLRSENAKLEHDLQDMKDSYEGSQHD